ncbi:PRC-barrel domain-containing protein [Fictibacillus nanhaiensis]|uniref:PRC-barrel domain-containing protein n=1 Tax=Fictibacillus nanhaiensis TaxID=742169 RepID=UPI001C98AFD2|nr:PRC-barrel domain-containing protein [Fictibacillus nanhaiensis]MBY6037049.1 PRC-barrel domain-containing protein [Fictibacillus nanhaiensis]
MKKSNDFIGLPIICIQDGTEAGRVKSLVVNSKQGIVDFLIVEQEDWELRIRAVPFEKVVSVGEFAVMIEDRYSIVDLTEIPIANQLTQKKLNATGSKLIDTKGQLIGEAKEYFIDEKDGSIIGIEIALQSNVVVFAADQVITYGRDLIVNEEAGLSFYQKVESIKSRKPIVKEDSNSDTKDLEPKTQRKLEEIPIKKMEENQKEHIDVNVNSAATPKDLIKERQLKLLTGKTTTKDIYEKDGNLLFPNGTTLRIDDVQKAQEKGPAILAELSMNVVG